MLGKDHALQLLEDTLARIGADQTEILIMTEETGVTRFANSTIHQNLAESGARVSVRSVLGKRIGCASTNRLEPEQLRATAARSVELARLQTENRDFVSLPAPRPITPVRAFSAATNASTPEARAAVVADIISMAQQEKTRASGVLSVEYNELAVGNTLGIRAYHAGTFALLNVIAADDTSSGYAHWMGSDISRLDHKAVAWNAIEKCVLGRRPT